MKRILLAGAALACLFGTQAMATDTLPPYVMPKPTITAAPSPVSGYVELYGQWAHLDYFGENPWAGLGGAGRVNWWVGPTTSLQVDFQGMGLFDYEQYYTGFEAAGFAHLSQRNANHLFGVFAGASATTEYDFFYGARNWVVGAEAQAYHGNFTFYGQVGYLHTSASYDGYLSSMWFGNVEARWFVAPDTKLAANIGFATGDVWDDGSKYNLVNYGAEIEHKFIGPMSAFARWDAFNYYGNTDNVWKAGVRFAIGQPSLFAQDRNGATLKVDELPALWIRFNDY